MGEPIQIRAWIDTRLQNVFVSTFEARKISLQDAITSMVRWITRQPAATLLDVFGQSDADRESVNKGTS